MGYTNETLKRIIPLLEQHRITSVIDLGAQNNYTIPLPAPYMKEWYEARDIAYTAIDISGENGSFALDLAYPLEDNLGQFDLLVDAGTSEHIGIEGKFDPHAIYNCWRTKHELVKAGGYMVNENPKSGHWPGHGFNYYTMEFYMRLQVKQGYKMLDIGEHPAMGNITDGMNIHSVFQKVNDNPFMSFEKFMECGIQTK